MARMKREKFTPIAGEVYRNQGGGTFRCLSSGKGLPAGEATMQNVASGWTFDAHGCGIYDDGTIDWDYSTNGLFKEVRS